MSGTACGHKRKQNKGQVRRRRRQLFRASLTVECAGVLPIFFIACLTVISFMHAIRIQSEENLRLSNKARRMAVAAAVAGERADGKWIDIAKTYTFEYPFPDFGIPKLRIALRARVYPFVGSSDGVSGYGPDGENSGNETVYVTDNREVYHTHADCSHLDLTIIKTDLAGVKNLRNAYGRKYKKCKGFPRGYKGPVYVTAKGDFYYPSTEFGSLTRHVHISKRSEHPDLCECKRCAARDRKEKRRAA